MPCCSSCGHTMALQDLPGGGPQACRQLTPGRRQRVPVKLQRETSVSRCRQCVNVSSQLLALLGCAPSPGYQRTLVYLGVFE